MEKCPKCGNDDSCNWDMPAFECDGDEAWQTITCDQCGYAWNTVYKFSHYEDADTMEVINENSK